MCSRMSKRFSCSTAPLPNAAFNRSQRQAGEGVRLFARPKARRGMIGQAMARYAGNLTEVARQLGITRQTLYNKIKRYGL